MSQMSFDEAANMPVHRKRLFGGIGTVVLIYAPLRFAEGWPAFWFLTLGLGISYGLGWLLDHTACQPEEHRDCFYCHECILCKRDDDASWCRNPPRAKVCETKSKIAPWKAES